MLNEFIDKVIVYERKKINRYQYDQQIEIYFNFIGKVTLPEEETEAAQEALKTLHVACNSSFAPIGNYLSAQTDEAIALPFSKVEELTGKPLCKSAYKYASYWYPAQDRPLSNTIYNAEYDVDRVDLAGRDRVSDESRITERTPRTVRLQDAWCGVFCVFGRVSCKFEFDGIFLYESGKH